MIGIPFVFRMPPLLYRPLALLRDYSHPVVRDNRFARGTCSR